jgi:glycosyltransferase involved in cell wall biosynthesis
MGLDLSAWPHSWDPSAPPRRGYYGGLGSAHNAREAMRCHREIMPRIWKDHPSAELWIIGSKPPPEILALKEDPRVRVTGFVERAQDVLQTLSVCLCPWTGTYGFRSRLVEVMAVGVPVVASPDAAYGMEFEHGRGIFFERDDESMARAAGRLVADAAFARAQSAAARASVETHYSFPATYGRLAAELLSFSSGGRTPAAQRASA